MTKSALATVAVANSRLRICSPVIAVLLGVVILGETVDVVAVVGMVIMLGAAWLALDASGTRLFEQNDGAAREVCTRSSG